MFGEKVLREILNYTPRNTRRVTFKLASRETKYFRRQLWIIEYFTRNIARVTPGAVTGMSEVPWEAIALPLALKAESEAVLGDSER